MPSNSVARDIVVIGASAGGVEALGTLVSGLPSDFPAAIFVELHTAPQAPGALANILDRSGRLPAETAKDGCSIKTGRIYVAPPDYHLLLSADEMVLSHGPRENNFRPAIDPLFRTAAQHFGQRVIGVILSGSLDDGALGLEHVRTKGGVAIVQHPEDALFSALPLNVMTRIQVDFVLPVRDISAKLYELVENGMLAKKKSKHTSKDPARQRQSSPNAGRRSALVDERLNSERTPETFTCPDCGGALWEFSKGGNLHYRCHVGHAYTAESLAVSQNGTVENALWSAVRALKERAELSRRMAGRMTTSRLRAIASRYLEKAASAEDQAASILQLLLESAEHKKDVVPALNAASPGKRSRKTASRR